MRCASHRTRLLLCQLPAASSRCIATHISDSNNSDKCVSEDVVTPWNVSAAGPKGIDYDRVLTRFKSEPVDQSILQQLHDTCNEGLQMRRVQNNNNNTLKTEEEEEQQQEQKPLHHFFHRGIVFSHRDFGKALDCVRLGMSTGTPRAYLYTGRGPSARSMHVGHVIPFLLTKYLQDALGLPTVIQITDDEKYFFRDIPVGGDMVMENIKDIIAFGFDPRKTFIFCNTTYMGSMYPTVVKVQRMLTLSAVKNTFGLRDSDNVGKAAFPAIQAAPCFSSAFPHVLQPQTEEKKKKKAHPLQCIVPCAIDQDPFFVLTRGVASRMKCQAPALLHTKFLPALKGMTFKMSSSAEMNGVITLHDTKEQVCKKMRRAFSGGGGTLADMQTKGVDLDADVAYQFIRFFSPDDKLFEEVTTKYSAGEMNSAQVKDMAADVVMRHVLSEWQQRRSTITDADVEHFCSVRNILL
ncbi:tryptophanyl-tRNA synthetase [Trypanosoma theileri]|uniref:tryptophan--tRNA ligase n=1 Tax=Trypanosoma theileri TaxID=67003 RepID=A0A1X0NGJ6_9TRYP|nr:tryptophanyl-tRNA synthetase [Trypanosoma theileri]ORC83711.1 tryptophanyl-tRNA synthetase [Trypanosoma theileri]